MKNKLMLMGLALALPLAAHAKDAQANEVFAVSTTTAFQGNSCNFPVAPETEIISVLDAQANEICEANDKQAERVSDLQNGISNLCVVVISAEYACT